LKSSLPAPHQERRSAKAQQRQLNNDTYQDFIYATPVSLPAALPVSAGTLVALLAFRKWKAKSAA